MRCSQEGCEATVCARGLCRYHYSRFLYKPMGTRGRYERARGRVCSVDGCVFAAYSKGMCKQHYRRQYMQKYRRKDMKRCRYCRTLIHRKQPDLCRKCREHPPSCLICGFRRFVEKAHVIPARKGGPRRVWNIVPLCPNHHKLYDRNKLTTAESRKLRKAVRVASKRFQGFANRSKRRACSTTP